MGCQLLLGARSEGAGSAADLLAPFVPLQNGECCLGLLLRSSGARAEAEDVAQLTRSAGLILHPTEKRLSLQQLRVDPVRAVKAQDLAEVPCRQPDGRGRAGGACPSRDLNCPLVIDDGEHASDPSCVLCGLIGEVADMAQIALWTAALLNPVVEISPTCLGSFRPWRARVAEVLACSR